MSIQTLLPFSRPAASRHRLTHLLLTMALSLMAGVSLAHAAKTKDIQGKSIEVPQGDFEAGPSFWEGRGAVVDDEHHTGSRSMLLQSGSTYPKPIADNLIKIDSNHDYRISVWIKTQGVSENGATLTGTILDKAPDGKWLGGWLKGSDPKYVHDNGSSPALLTTGGTHDWKKFTAGIPASQIASNGKLLFLYLRHDAHKPAQGKVWFDDLTVEELPKGTIKIKIPDTPVRNGEFENSKQNWGGRGSQVIADTANPKNHVMEITGTGFALQQNILVDDAKHYRLSMKIKNQSKDDVSGYVQISFRGSRVGGEWRGPVQIDKGRHTEAALFITGGNHDWKTFSAVIAIPSRATQMLIYLRKLNDDGKVLYDDVKLEAVDEPVTEPQTLRKQGMAPPEPLFNDTDFARDALANTNFAQGQAGWILDGNAKIVQTDSSQHPYALYATAGSAVQGLKVKQGGRYRINIAIRTQVCAPDTASLRVRFRGTHLRPQWGGAINVPTDRRKQAGVLATGGTHDWQQFSGVVEAPRGADTMLIYLYKSQDDGSAWFSDLSVQPTNDPAPTREQLAQADLDRLLPPPAANLNAASIIQALQALGSQATPATLTLADAGNAAYHIHLGNSTDPVVLNAATELADYLQRISSASFMPLSQDISPLTGPLLIVGKDNALAKGLWPDVDYAALGDDGFVIRTKGPHVLIAGNTPRGTLYGVYWLLDHELGVKWFSPSYTYIPNQSNLTLASPNITQTPRFIYRAVFSRDTDAPWYRQHNLLNGNSHHRKALYPQAGIDTWSNYWPDSGFFQQIVNARKYAKTHPEYFTGGQLAVMNPEVRKIAAERLVQIIQQQIKKGYGAAYGFDQEDRGWGPDAASKAFAKAHGGALSAPVLDMMIEVANRVDEQIPGARIAMQAYHWSYPAPTGMKVPDNILMTLAPIEANFAQPFNGPTNEKIAQDTKDWARIANHIVVWDYITNFGNYLMPYPNIPAMFESIQWLAKYPSIQGYFGQGSYGSSGAEFAQLRAWVAARLLWDPNQDPQALIDQFVKGYYGDASPYISQYIKLLHDSAQKTNSKITIRTQVTTPYLSFEAMHKADELFDQAQTAVANAPGFLRRVKTARLGVDTVILLRRAVFDQQGKEQNIAWPANHQARLHRFIDSAADAGVTRYGEGVGSVNKLIATMRIDRTVPTVPAMVADLSADKWIDFQDMDLRLYGHTSIVSDPLASDHAAVRMPGNVPVWGIQLGLDSLPPEGKWKFYLSARIDPATEQSDGTARALGFGIQPGATGRATVDDLKDGQYHLLEVPGGAYQHDPGRSLWIAPPNSNAIQAMYIDRVIAIRAD